MGRPPESGADAVVADLDSLRQEAQDVAALLYEWRVAAAIPLLFSSVYPLDLQSRHYHGLYDALQPPFPGEDLSDRLRRLLERGASEPANLDPSAPPREGANGTAGDLA